MVCCLYNNDSNHCCVIAQTATKGSQELLAESMENYEKAFNKIKEVTNCPNINELVKRFTQVEDQNFSLFNYVNEINNQIGSVSDELAHLEREMNSWQVQNAGVEEASKKQLKEMESKLKATQEATELYQGQYDSMSQVMEDLSVGIERLVTTLQQKSGSSDAPVSMVDPEKSVDTAGAKENLVSAQLSWIEQKTNALLMKNLLLALPKKFTFAAAPTAASPDKKDGAAQEGADKNQPLIETSKDPAALAAMLQSMISAEDTANGFNLASILGQGPSAPVAYHSIHVPSTGFV